MLTIRRTALAEKGIEESQERYRSLVESQTDLVCRFTPDGRFVFINDVYCQFFNKSKADLIGSVWQPLPVDDDATVIEQKLSTLSPANPIVSIENRVYSGKGDIHWMQFINRGFFDRDGQLLEIQSVGRDITDRKQAEVSLQQREEQYRTIFENAVEGIFQSTPQGRFTSVNPAFARMLGYDTPEELVENISDIAKQYYFNAEDRQRYQRIIQENGIVENFEFRARRKDGSTTWVSNSTQAYFDETGNVIRYEGFVTDINARKQAEREKEKLQLQLLQAQKLESIGNLAGGIAHDFNNILSAILGYTELALDDVEKGSLIENNLNEVFTAGRRARDLVQQILAFARQADAELKPVQVSKIAKEALKLIRSTIPTTIEIRQNIDCDALIMGDPTQINQIFMNLCTNAAFAMEQAGGILAVDLSDVELDNKAPLVQSGLSPGNYLLTTIADTGTGIAGDILDSIFEPYFTTKGVGEGTGLGLAVVHGIVEGYGGKITVTSDLGQGTVFSVYLPITRTHDDYRPFKEAILPTGNERILLVDDESSIAKVGSQILERLGYRVAARTSSVEALELFRAKPDDFDLVVTDMTMPNMTGDQLATELMKIRPDVLVILCTGYSNKISDQSAQAMGIKALIYKPIVKADLAKTMRKVLDEART
jgi:PAS domain S-box-containing protein